MVVDEEQMRFYPGPRTRAEASAWLDRNLSLYEKHGFGFWLIGSVDAEFLGYCGIRPVELDGAETTEIGWHTLKTSWNQGIATEAAAAVRDMAFTRFARKELVALIYPEHVASRRVAEKLGLREGAVTVIDGDPYVTYEARYSSI